LRFDFTEIFLSHAEAQRRREEGKRCFDGDISTDKHQTSAFELQHSRLEQERSPLEPERSRLEHESSCSEPERSRLEHESSRSEPERSRLEQEHSPSEHEHPRFKPQASCSRVEASSKKGDVYDEMRLRSSEIQESS
jgi:hypothetical protein